jgi:hypothetical protein
MVTGRAHRSQTHVMRDTGNPPLDEANESWPRPEFGIGDEFGLDKLNYPAPCFDRARADGKDILDPLHIGPVGQIEEILVASSKDIDRCAVETSALAPTMRQDRKAGEPPGEGPRESVDIAPDDVPETPNARAATRLVAAAAHESTLPTVPAASREESDLPHRRRRRRRSSALVASLLVRRLLLRASLRLLGRRTWLPTRPCEPTPTNRPARRGQVRG